jgi:hypothetical protein
MPFSQAESLVMTIPQLLSIALKMQTGDAQARYVFSVGAWSLESAKENHRILSLRTPDCFEVAFAMSVETSMAMGSALTRATEAAPEDKGFGKASSELGQPADEIKRRRSWCRDPGTALVKLLISSVGPAGLEPATRPL